MPKNRSTEPLQITRRGLSPRPNTWEPPRLASLNQPRKNSTGGPTTSGQASEQWPAVKSPGSPSQPTECSQWERGCVAPAPRRYAAIGVSETHLTAGARAAGTRGVNRRLRDENERPTL